MAIYKQYSKKDGSKAWLFQAYLGVDEVTGKEVRTTRRGFESKKAAQLALNELVVDFQNDNRQSNDNITYKEVYEEWLEHYKHTVKESSLAKTLILFKYHIIPYFGDMRIKKIEVKHCQKLANQLSKKLKRFKMTLNYAGMVFDYSIRIGLIQNNPMKLITTPVIKDEIEEEVNNFYSRDELTEFFSYLEKENDPMMFSLFRVLAFVGCRKGEALALTWNDINFDKQQITISKTLTRGLDNRLLVQTPKTANSKRVISVDDKTIEILKKWRVTQKKEYFTRGHNTLKKSQLVFSNLSNELLQPHITRKYQVKLEKKYGMRRITTHGFRHTHCSLLFEAGASIKEVQDRLGHSDIQTTMNIYAHVSKEKKEQTADIFAKYVGI